MAIGRLFGADDVLAGRVPSIVLAAAVVPMLCMLGEALTAASPRAWRRRRVR
jgi:hypothetical protein